MEVEHQRGAVTTSAIRARTRRAITAQKLIRILGSTAVVGLILLAFANCSTPGKSSVEATTGQIRIVANDDSFDAPDSIVAGMTHIVFENRGSTIHEVMFIKLPDGMSGEDYLAIVRSGSSFPEGALDYSGPGLTSPGGSVEAWLHLDPGNYILACWFKGHLESAPAQTLSVLDIGPSDVTPPKEDATLRLMDFRFQLDGELRSGPQVVRVEMVGPSMHEVDIFRLHEGRTLDDLRAWQKSGKTGPSPGEAVGGVLDSHDTNRTVWLKTLFRPGRHVLWCNMALLPDAPGPEGGVSHAEAGMFMEIMIED